MNLRQVLAVGALAASALVHTGCITPPGPMERLSNAAYEMNTATRFGRMDIAIAHVAAEARDDFANRHRAWHGDLRIVDVELAGLRMLTPTSAQVDLEIGWHDIRTSNIQVTRISQKWMSNDGDAWQLREEVRSGGAPGLFDHSEPKSPFKDEVERPARKSSPVDQTLTTTGWQ